MKDRVSVNIISILAIAFVSVMLYRLLAPESQPPQINLPAISPSETYRPGEEPAVVFIDQGEISYSSLLSIVSGLRVSWEYSRRYRITTYWPESSGEQRSSERHFSVSAREGDCLIVEYTGANSIRKNILLRGETVTRWDGDNYDSAYSHKAPTGLSQGRLRDLYQCMYSIEDLLSIPAEDMVYACFADLSGTPCIYAEFYAGEFRILNKLFIGTESGLVLSEERYDDGALIYKTESISLSLTPPEDRAFSSFTVDG